MNFMFSWQEQYLTRSLRSLVRYCSCHSNIKFISSRHRVISSIDIAPRTIGNLRQSWILDSMPQIPDSRYWIPVFVSGTWILNSSRYLNSGFLEMYSRIQSPRFHILLHGQIWELLAPGNGFLILFQKSQRYIKPNKRGGVFSVHFCLYVRRYNPVIFHLTHSPCPFCITCNS